MQAAETGGIPGHFYVVSYFQYILIYSTYIYIYFLIFV